MTRRLDHHNVPANLRDSTAGEDVERDLGLDGRTRLQPLYPYNLFNY